MKTLTLTLNGEYFDAIRDGQKREEYRLFNDYWKKRLVGRRYDEIVLTRGYPSADDHSRRLRLPWIGYRIVSITHKHFGNQPVTVFAIDVSGDPVLPGVFG